MTKITYTYNVSEMTEKAPPKSHNLVASSNGENIIINPDDMVTRVEYEAPLHQAKLAFYKDEHGSIHLWVKRFGE